MLSQGTRIGSQRILQWIREGSCGQSYQTEEGKGNHSSKRSFLKLIHRDISERKGFGEYFVQEAQALEQLQGRGVWPMAENGVTKWKHWISYDWLEGKPVCLASKEEESTHEIDLRTLEDWMRFSADNIGPDELLSIMTDLHCGLERAHKMGVIHGNLKPTNVLLKEGNDGLFSAWATEFGLYKLTCYEPLGENADNEDNGFYSQSLQFQESQSKSLEFRPSGVGAFDCVDETWDLYGLGKLVQWVIEASSLSRERWSAWEKWSNQSLSSSFPTIAHSMKAMPGVAELSQFGIALDESMESNGPGLDEIRKQRELEWMRAQKTSSLSFRKKMTGLVGALFLSFYLLSRVYLFFYPTPWVEYSMEGVLDKYQLGFGLISGKAWGILPAEYDDEGSGGQDVVGEWERSGRIFKLNFRKFKKSEENQQGKKLWQFIGKGATSPDDYVVWEDYLRFDQSEQRLLLVKRIGGNQTYLPARKEGGVAHLFPEVRIRRSQGKITPAELSFSRTDHGGVSWTLFLGIGFLFASYLYHRNLKSFEGSSEGKG